MNFKNQVVINVNLIQFLPELIFAACKTILPKQHLINLKGKPTFNYL